jgi:hypothetical protein
MSRFTPTDPDLSPIERARRAEAARRLYFGRLALRSSIKRAKKSPTAIVTPAGLVTEASGNARSVS